MSRKNKNVKQKCNHEYVEYVNITEDRKICKRCKKCHKCFKLTLKDVGY